LSIWAAAALPMAFMGWIVAPALAAATGATSVVDVALTRLGALTLGLLWLVVLSVLIVFFEEGNVRWGTLCRRLRLNAPRSPRTGQPNGKLWLWAILLLVLVAVWGLFVAPRLNLAWTSLLPFFAEPSGFALGSALGSPAGRAQFVGAWGVLALFAVNAAFNILGEELLFRGVLLPRMNRQFGRWDWLANGLLFGAYHLHQPWAMLASVGSGALLYALPAKYFRSTWMSIITHSGQSVYFLFIILGLVLGLAR
jgi:membrane protease YdiL (CAAX protease family)